jgi:hypothetical protein
MEFQYFLLSPLINAAHMITSFLHGHGYIHWVRNSIIEAISFHLTSSFHFLTGRKVGFIPLIFFGAGGIPFAQPKSSPLTVVVGKPIHVPKLGKDAPKEELEKYHKQFLDAYTRIFEKNKKRFGMGDITLKIV